MIPRRYLILGLGAVIAILAGLAGVDSCSKNAGSYADHQAHVYQGEANAHQAQAGASDAKIKDLQAKLDDQKQDLDRLSKERDALLRRLASKPLPANDPAGSIPGSDVVDALEAAVAIRDEAIAKDAEVIESQKVVIDSQSGVISELTLSRDHWKATAEARERQAMAQAEATKAWKEAVTTSRWRGRIEGFAAGVALGYVARGQR